MAVGTELTQPVSALDGAYFCPPLDAHPRPLENGCQGDRSKSIGEPQKGPKDVLGRPPRPSIAIITHRINSPLDSEESISKDVSLPQPLQLEVVKKDFKPVIRSGVWSDIGPRSAMEDEHVRIDNLMDYLDPVLSAQTQGAFYAVFDGHGGKKAAQFVKKNILKFILEDVSFPSAIEESMHQAFLRTDMAFAEACASDQSGTTAITVLIFGKMLVVANAGDCRAVLCKKGKAFEMSRDHKPCCIFERDRIEALGGFIDDGYLNGQLAVARALGDWHMTDVKGVGCPLSPEPELQQVTLMEDDEFLIIGCDGLWDVFSSQNAVDFARRKLQQHNDPERCSHELVTEALSRHTTDNLTVVVVCFQEAAPPRDPSKFQVRRSIAVDSLRNLQHYLDSAL